MSRIVQSKEDLTAQERIEFAVWCRETVRDPDRLYSLQEFLRKQEKRRERESKKLHELLRRL